MVHIDVGRSPHGNNQRPFGAIAGDQTRHLTASWGNRFCKNRLLCFWNSSRSKCRKATCEKHRNQLFKSQDQNCPETQKPKAPKAESTNRRKHVKSRAMMAFKTTGTGFQNQPALAFKTTGTGFQNDRELVFKTTETRFSKPPKRGSQNHQQLVFRTTHKPPICLLRRRACGWAQRQEHPRAPHATRPSLPKTTRIMAHGVEAGPLNLTLAPPSYLRRLPRNQCQSHQAQPLPTQHGRGSSMQRVRGSKAVEC